MNGEWTREQPCYDATDRERVLRVLLTDHNLIGIHTPPGSLASLTIIQAAVHLSHVGDAITEATRRADSVPGLHLQYERVHDLLDYNDQPRRLGVAARDGWVNVTVPGWCKATPDDGDQLADSIRAASVVARYQRRNQR